MYIFDVEDGTGKPNSTSFASVTEADEVAEFLGDPDWDMSNIEERERRLILATRKVNHLLRWSSTLLTETQSLNFPRKPFTDIDGRLVQGVPSIIKDFTIALAIKSQSMDINVKPVRLKSQGWGSSKEDYQGGYIDDEVGITDMVIMLKSLGYGVGNTTIVEMQRA